MVLRTNVEPVPEDAGATLAAGIRRLAMQKDLAGMAGVAAETAAELVHGLRSRCYFYYAEEGLLWTPDGDELPSPDGLAGAAARAGERIVADRADAVATYCSTVDDPHGTGCERIVAQPVVTPGGETHAVVVVVRSGSLPPFTDHALGVLGLWAEQAAPLFHMLHVEGEAEQTQLRAGVVGRPGRYREEALADLLATGDGFGTLLQSRSVTPRVAYLLAALATLAVLLFLALVDVREYAAGPAFVVSRTHRDVAAKRDGVVETVLVTPGQQVVEGDELARYVAAEARTAVIHAEAELERSLLARLRDPVDPTLELEVASARADRDRARARMADARIVAPASGRVADVRIEPGRAVGAGQIVVTIASGDVRTPVVRALVPGRHRPALEVGQRMNLSVSGFADATQHLQVTAISDEVLGVGEVRRVVGSQIADVLDVRGPVIIVEAELESTDIEVDGRRWTMHDGMLGEAEVAVRDKPAGFLLFPELEGLLSDD